MRKRRGKGKEGREGRRDRGRKDTPFLVRLVKLSQCQEIKAGESEIRVQSSRSILSYRAISQLTLVM